MFRASLDSHSPFHGVFWSPLDKGGNEGSKSQGSRELSQPRLVINSSHGELEPSYSGVRSTYFFVGLLRYNWHVTLYGAKGTACRFGTSICCNMTATVVSANTSILPHHYHFFFFLQWKQLRSSLLATLRCVIQRRERQSRCCALRPYDLLIYLLQVCVLWPTSLQFSHPWQPPFSSLALWVWSKHVFLNTILIGLLLCELGVSKWLEYGLNQGADGVTCGLKWPRGENSPRQISYPGWINLHVSERGKKNQVSDCGKETYSFHPTIPLWFLPLPLTCSLLLGKFRMAGSERQRHIKVWDLKTEGEEKALERRGVGITDVRTGSLKKGGARDMSSIPTSWWILHVMSLQNKKIQGGIGITRRSFNSFPFPSV